MKQIRLLLIVGLGLAVVAVLLYLQNPEPQPLSDPDGSGTIEAEQQAEDAGEAQTASSQTDPAPETSPEPAPEPAPEATSEATPEPTTELTAAGPEAPGAETSSAPEVTQAEPQEALLPEAPTFDVVRVDRDGSAVIAGRATPGAEVEVLSAPATPLPGTAVEADARGEFVALPDGPLAPGRYDLRLRSRLGAEGDWVVSDQSVLVMVPNRSGVAEGEGASQGVTSVLLSDRPGEGARVLQSPEGLGLTSGELAVQIIDYDEEGNLVIAGNAPPRARLFVYLDDTALADTLADAAGRWNVLPSDPVTAGSHSLRVDQIGEDGKVIARIEARFYRTAGEPTALASGEITVEPGNSLWRIARRTYGQGTRYTLIYQANKEQIRDPDLIYPGQIFILPEESGATQ